MEPQELPAEVPAEGWYQIDLEGVWNGHPAGAYRLTPADIRGIADYFDRTCKANGVDIPVDYEHQGTVARLLGKRAESAGWIHALEARENDAQLWAHIKWVADARALIRDRKFRYLSSHLMPNYKDPVTGKVVPWVLDSVALTNRPFKKELPAVANSDAAAAGLGEGRSGAPGSAVAEEEEGAMGQLLAQLAAAMNEGRAERGAQALPGAPALDAKAVANSLGVQEDAGTDVVVKAVAERLQALAEPNPLQARAAEAETKLLAVCNALGATPDRPLAELLALVGAQRTDPAQSAAERMIENAISVERKVTPANREAFIRLAVQDFENARRILNSMPPVLNGAMNAAGAAASGEAAVLTEADQWACQQTGIKEADFLATKKRMAG